MVADAEYNKADDSDEAISLQFESLVTALEFEIETGVIGAAGNSITVQQVSLISKSQETDISGIMMLPGTNPLMKRSWLTKHLLRLILSFWLILYRPLRFLILTVHGV